ncbi:hypothetical protein N7539_004105 [Penicillium diatomitis]|uniref:Uncharacterized protein n=1 Tax=Penicillium diatomitis TaxID=2819901 RepID=A0A9W9XD67_9EURO|nr:uncharacterized protein N7539_004105 [Penicillium diatomitis]KAJ5489215.1 hypothetical protein N7539_004105 [Penicillium diatomitis]
MDIVFHNGTNGGHPWVEFYPYTPSASAGYAFLAIFGIVTVMHFVLMFPYRAAYFLPLVIGGICTSTYVGSAMYRFRTRLEHCIPVPYPLSRLLTGIKTGESFGYYGRAWSHHDRTDIRSWALQEMLILCAPPLIAATIYIVLGRIIRAFDAEHLSSMRPKRMTLVFVLNDVICFCTQLGGAGVQVTGDANIMNIGKKVVLAGLIFSLLVFIIFVAVAVSFHRRLQRQPTAVLGANPDLSWKRYMWSLYVACAALAIRNLVRTIQFGANRTADINTKEVYIYVFDAFLMALSMGVMVVYHPGLLVKKARRAVKVAQLGRPSTSEPNRNSGSVPLIPLGGR